MPSDLQVSNIRDLNNANSAISIASDGQVTIAQNNPTITLGNNTTFPAGHVLQVKCTVVIDRNDTTETSTSGTGGDVGLNVTINPIKRNGSYFFIVCSIGMGSCTSGTWGIILSRDGTKVGNGADVSTRNGVFIRGSANYNGDNNHGWGVSNSIWDSSGATAGASTTFKAGLVCQSGSAAINRSQTNSDNALVFGSYTSSSLTVMEIAQ
tara:strand:- start:866 stop:1492 length:627 start_codon:yes stop_codon:yes gene_type:complete